eukprot:g8121.t1
MFINTQFSRLVRRSSPFQSSFSTVKRVVLQEPGASSNLKFESVVCNSKHKSVGERDIGVKIAASAIASRGIKWVQFDGEALSTFGTVWHAVERGNLIEHCTANSDVRNDTFDFLPRERGESLCSISNSNLMTCGSLPVIAISSTETASTVALPAAMVTFLKFAPPIACQFVFLAPLAAMKQFKADNSTGDVSAIPYAAMTVNGALWVMYGLLKSDPTIILPNVSGFFFGAYYTYTYGRYTQKSMTPYYGGIVAGIGFCVSVAAMMETAAAINTIGLFGCGIVAVMFGGPLGAIKTVINDENTNSLPVAFTVATFVNCVCWSSYGWFVIDDIYVWGPNLAGLSASIAQLSLYAKYGLPQKS